MNSIDDIVKRILDNKSIGILPIENSIEGIVTISLDQLYFNNNIYINYEITKKINIVLASNRNIKDISEIKTLYTNPVAYNECRNNIEKIGIKNIIFVNSTSEAASKASKDLYSASLCSKKAAEIYGLKIIDEKISDNDKNETRFFIISKNLLTNGDKTSIIFTIPDRAGSLYEALGVFKKYNINLSFIYSRPMRDKPWHYYFYLEFDGSLEEENVKNALKELENKVNSIKILGSYSIIESYN